MKKYPEDFKNWVSYVYKEYNKDYYATGAVFGRVTIVADLRNTKTGKAIRHPNDEDNRQVGFAIAYARLRQIPIPKQRKTISLSAVPYGKPFYLKNNILNGTYYKAHEENNFALCVTRDKDEIWKVQLIYKNTIVEIDDN